MSSKRAGVHTGGAFNREKVLDVLTEHYGPHSAGESAIILQALEACVVPDTRIARIEALCADEEARTAEYGQGLPVLFVEDVRAALNGGEQLPNGAVMSHPEDMFEAAMQRRARAVPVESADIVRVHYGDPDSHAHAWNDGWDTAITQVVDMFEDDGTRLSLAAAARIREVFNYRHIEIDYDGRPNSEAAPSA
jgi:hypothetical protein